MRAAGAIPRGDIIGDGWKIERRGRDSDTHRGTVMGERTPDVLPLRELEDVTEETYAIGVGPPDATGVGSAKGPSPTKAYSEVVEV